MAPEQQRPKLVLLTEDSFAALVRLFMSPANPRWAQYADETRDLWGRELEFAARPDCLGALSRLEIRPSLVQAFFDAIADRPYKQAASKAALHAFEKWAIVRDYLPRPITLGTELSDTDGGHTPWSESQVAIGAAKARPDIARAIILGANTGQRGSDLIRMGPTDIEVFDGMEGIRVIQKKTKREVWIPILSSLASVMATWERRPGPFLTREDGRPWERKELTDAWAYERATNPELKPLLEDGLVMHGLRGHACVRLYRSGATTRQVADMVGMSEMMVSRYTRKSLQRENASAAVFNLERTIRERKVDTSKKSAG